MNNVKRELVEVREAVPQLQIVTPGNGAGRRNTPSAPFVLLSSIRTRRPRAELAVLSWSNRAIRLAGKK
jgi:hypothetical protein